MRKAPLPGDWSVTLESDMEEFNITEEFIITNTTQFLKKALASINGA